MDPAETCEARIPKRRDGAENPRLFAVLELGLEADHVPKRSEGIVLTELHYRIRAPAGLGIAQSHGLHRPEAQRILASRRHHLDGEAALEIGRALFPFVELGHLA